MPPPLLLPSPLGHSYYEAAQVAAFAVYVALLLGQGYRRGYAQRAWLPLVAGATLRLPAGLRAVILEPYFATDFDRHNIFSMKLHYQLGGK